MLNQCDRYEKSGIVVCDECARIHHYIACGVSGWRHPNWPDGPFWFDDPYNPKSEQLELFCEILSTKKAVDSRG